MSGKITGTDLCQTNDSFLLTSRSPNIKAAPNKAVLRHWATSKVVRKFLLVVGTVNRTDRKISKLYRSDIVCTFVKSYVSTRFNLATPNNIANRNLFSGYSEKWDERA